MCECHKVREKKEEEVQESIGRHWSNRG